MIGELERPHRKCAAPKKFAAGTLTSKVRGGAVLSLHGMDRFPVGLQTRLTKINLIANRCICAIIQWESPVPADNVSAQCQPLTSLDGKDCR